MNEVIVVGAGPVGLMLAAELRLAGADVAILERLDAPTGLSKALAVTGRGEDYLAMRGLLERFRLRAPSLPPAGVLHFALIPLDIRKTGLCPKGVFVPQAVTEEILEARARELGVVIRRGVCVVSLVQDGDGVELDTIQNRAGVKYRARYVVGCDGAHSVVRRAAGIGFVGAEATSLLRLGDVKLEEGCPAPPMLIPLGDGWLRLITKEPLPAEFDPSAPMTLEELRASACRVFRLDLPLREARWLSRFTDASRQADAYRRGRILIAGDAAHVHLPAGGPGLLTGFGDALNLGWKLGAVLRRSAPSAILDSYEAERRPVGARVIEQTRAQGRLASPDAGSLALRGLLQELADIPAVVEHLLCMLWQMDVRYRGPHDSTHELMGTFVPETTVLTNDGARSMFSLLRDGRWLAIETRPTFDARVDRLGAIRIAVDRLDGIPDARAILVRPDGHIAWAGDVSDASLESTLLRWSGEAPSKSGSLFG